MNQSKLYVTGRKYLNKGMLDKAYECFLEAAMAEDDADAMSELGDMYYSGDYVHQDYGKAGLYYAMAYDRGAKVTGAELIMAGSYWESKAEEEGRRPAEAIRYYEASIERGEAYGYECIGKLFFELGEYDKAYENLIKTKGRGPCGYYYLGRMYDEGLGVEQNTQIALKYYKKAVEHGYDPDGECLIDDDAKDAQKRLEETHISSLRPSY